MGLIIVFCFVCFLVCLIWGLGGLWLDWIDMPSQASRQHATLQLTKLPKETIVKELFVCLFLLYHYKERNLRMQFQ